MYDQDYGDYGRDRRRDRENGRKHRCNRPHKVRFLASCRMGGEEPSPAQVLNEVRRTIHEYQHTGNKPRKYTISIAPTDVVISEESKIVIVIM